MGHSIDIYADFTQAGKAYLPFPDPRSFRIRLADLRDERVHQFLGIELNPRDASLAELVLWIGYLQWHFRTRGQTAPAEPVLKKIPQHRKPRRRPRLGR